MAEKKIFVLIAEDEKPLAKALTYKLKKSGFEAVAVYNGQEALDYIEKNKVDVIILDLVMPHVDGFTFLKILKEKEINIPVIVASNLGQEKDVKEAKSLGAVDYIVKADTPLGDIIERINKLIK